MVTPKLTSLSNYNLVICKAIKDQGEKMTEQFERDKISYEQHCESFRSLNTQMWQVPMIAMTLTGGLWFGVFSSDLTNTAATALYLFCALCDLLFILILFRVRLIMGLILEKLTLFNENYSISFEKSKKGIWLTKQENLVVITFSIMLGLASLISFFIAWNIVCP